MSETKAKHTPGPWVPIFNEYGPYEEIMIFSNPTPTSGRRVGEVYNARTFDDVPVAEWDEYRERAIANAHLMAAAPDLLQELKNIANARVHDSAYFENADDFVAWAQSRARHAISKVEGREA